MKGRPLLRAVTKASFDHIRFPILPLPPNMTWSGALPAKQGYEKFYAESISSVLCLPKHWHSYESEHVVNNRILAKFLLASVENTKELGYFNTGVTITIFEQSDAVQLQVLAESLRQNTMKEVGSKLGGFTDWKMYGEHLLISSIRYTTQVPTMRLGNQTVKAAEMLFIQDLILERQRGIVFLMKYETPKSLFTSEMEETFRVIKTNGYFAVPQNTNETNQSGSNGNGFVFLEL